MKNLTIGLFILSIGSAHAAKTCYGTEGQCSRRNDKICGTITKINDSLYRISDLEQVKGCAAWGVSRLKNKNKICGNLLSKFGVTQKVSYHPGSEVRGEMTAFLGSESIGEVTCEVR